MPDLNYMMQGLTTPIEPGNVVVHNTVKHARRQGTRGFRYWQQKPDGKPTVEPCSCSWAPELGVHYRVVLSR